MPKRSAREGCSVQAVVDPQATGLEAKSGRRSAGVVQCFPTGAVGKLGGRKGIGRGARKVNQVLDQLKHGLVNAGLVFS